MYASNKFKVLIIDDDVECLDTLERLLRKDYQVFRAGNGLEAIHVLDREGEMALVIVDLNMPVVDGVEFLFGIISAFPNTIRIVLTAGREVDYFLTAINDLKLFRYMLKPFDREELRIIVRQATDLYQMQTGKSYRVPPEGVLQFAMPSTENLVVEIDQSLREQQVAEILSSDLFASLRGAQEVVPQRVDENQKNATVLLDLKENILLEIDCVLPQDTYVPPPPPSILDSEEFLALERQSEELIARIAQRN